MDLRTLADRCLYNTYLMKGTEVPNPRRSSACDSGMRMLRQPGRAQCTQQLLWIYLRGLQDIKKRAYGQRVREREHGVFTPLVFSTTGGMGREATTFYKRLADKLAWKQQKPYSVVMSWLRCKLSFAAIRSSIMCIRGSRSSTHRLVRDADITLATSEGFVPLQD